VSDTINGFDVMRGFLPSSPFVQHLGVELLELEPDRATLRLPFIEQVVTIGETIHGGAIASLIDTTAMAAAWATDQAPASMRGTTVGITVNYLAAANKTDLVARARVVRRGRSLCHVDVEVTDSDELLVAKGLVTYKLG
jgi:uncharacterized protein (TIGR00369 family)